MVPRPAPLWVGAARRLRFGAGANRAVDLRPAPCTRNHSLSPHDGQDRTVTHSVPLTCKERPRLRGWYAQTNELWLWFVRMPKRPTADKTRLARLEQVAEDQAFDE